MMCSLFNSVLVNVKPKRLKTLTRTVGGVATSCLNETFGASFVQTSRGRPRLRFARRNLYVPLVV